MMNKPDIIHQLKNYFSASDAIDSVYLFGSTAKNKQRPNSDIDIAVLFGDDLSELDRFDRKLNIASELEDLLGSPVDIVDLRTSDPYFIHQIMLNKELIYDMNTNARVAFEVEARREYFDRIPFYELYHKQAMKRLEER